MRRRIWLVCALLGLPLVAAAVLVSLLRPPGRPPGVPAVGGSFQLTDQDGRAVSEKDLLGKPSAIFFGFTYCPDVCPTTLLEITSWMKALGGDADKLNVVFVSVDSERDTPASMKLYLSSFDPRIRGFSGTEAQIQQITKAYRVFYKRVPVDGSGYTYDHSAIIYLMNAKNTYVGMLTYRESDANAVAKLRDLTDSARQYRATVSCKTCRHLDARLTFQLAEFS
jgi:protein SCO1/2